MHIEANALPTRPFLSDATLDDDSSSYELEEAKEAAERVLRSFLVWGSSLVMTYLGDLFYSKASGDLKLL